MPPSYSSFRSSASRPSGRRRTPFAGTARCRFRAGLLLSLLVSAPVATTVSAQQPSSAPASDRAAEVASLVDLAVTEYRDAVSDGEIVNQMEYAESREFTSQAARLFREIRRASPAGGPADRVAADLDTLTAMVERRVPVEAFRQRAERISSTLAEEWGAVTVPEPSRPPSAARGAEIYRMACAVCHGPEGRGHGRAAEGMKPPPADLAAPIRRREATPARDYQVTTYGIPETAMPASRDWLSVEETWDVVAYLQTLRFGGGEVAEGKALALGPVGGSPVAGYLRPWSSPAATARLTDVELARRVRTQWRSATDESDGVGAAPAGDAPADTLGIEQTRAVVAYLRSLLGTPATGVPETDRSATRLRRVEEADSLAAAAARAARAGRADEARSTALRAYMAFEGVEPELRARAPDLVPRIEAAFGDLRAEVTAGTRDGAGTGDGATAGGADGALERVQGLLADARDRLSDPATAWSLATQSFFIILREGFEAILIVGAILAFLTKTGHEDRRRDVYWGVAVALAASAATAVVLQRILEATPASRELLEGATMLLAVAVLFSVSYWLLSKVEHQKWERYLKSKMHSALGAGSGLALAGVAFLAVYREGFETVIFYQALLGFSHGGFGAVAGGFGVGCVALAIIYVLFTRFSMRVPMRPFFAVTSAVLYYMAVVFAGSGIRELQEAGVVGTTRFAGVPRIELLGVYPTVETLAAQGVLLLALAVALWITFGPSLRRSESSAARA